MHCIGLGFCCVALDGLELSLEIRLYWNSQEICLLSAGSKGVLHHAQLAILLFSV